MDSLQKYVYIETSISYPEYVRLAVLDLGMIAKP